MKILILALSFVIIILIGVFFVFNKPVTAPVVSMSPSPSQQSQSNITIISPIAGDLVTSPIIITGQARVFENQFNWRLTDANGNKILEGTAMSDAKDVGLFGNYQISISVPKNAPKNLIIEVLDYSAKDGSVVDLVKVPVILK